ncbi:hypothetical protein SAMN04490184_0841 [Pseudomonas extremorientalis]|uniref:Transposase n=1 Tax=Pseudomonas extremorientalis TaxID=169669 RepID=A0ABY0RWE2_9PSED|nr:hypothetical protein SAMN04490184_0841 [Pseudomonas extremorientalis]
MFYIVNSRRVLGVSWPDCYSQMDQIRPEDAFLCDTREQSIFILMGRNS